MIDMFILYMFYVFIFIQSLNISSLSEISCQALGFWACKKWSRWRWNSRFNKSCRHNWIRRPRICGFRYPSLLCFIYFGVEGLFPKNYHGCKDFIKCPSNRSLDIKERRIQLRCCPPRATLRATSNGRRVHWWSRRHLGRLGEAISRCLEAILKNHGYKVERRVLKERGSSSILPRVTVPLQRPQEPANDGRGSGRAGTAAGPPDIASSQAGASSENVELSQVSFAFTLTQPCMKRKPTCLCFGCCLDL